MPTVSIQINGTRIRLALPREEGVKWDYIGVFLEDLYGLARLKPSILTVLDVGGNAGLFSTAARHYFPEAKIHCYEPNPQVHQFACVQARHCDFDLFPEAIGGRNGFVSMEFPAGTDSNLGRTVEERNGSIPRVAFRDAIARMGEEVDLLKLDCEGAEWELFKQADCWPLVRSLTMEYHLFCGETHQQLRRTVEGLGFSVRNHVYTETSHSGHVQASNRRFGARG